MRFTKALSVSGNLHSSYVFEDEHARQQWLASALPVLQEEYGKLTVREFDLDGLQVNDRCYVIGDGDERYTILGLTKFEPHRYGFQLSHGFVEEVAKCYR